MNAISTATFITEQVFRFHPRSPRQQDVVVVRLLRSLGVALCRVARTILGMPVLTGSAALPKKAIYIA